MRLTDLNLPVSVPTIAALSLVVSSILSGAESRPDVSELPPDVSTYAGIDAALAGRIVMSPGAMWRYFPGVENPSPKYEWTKDEFDDSGSSRRKHVGPVPKASALER